MLKKEIEDILAERIVDRMQEANELILKQIGDAVRQISMLTPSQAYQLAQILKYGGSYEKIAYELARVSGKNIQEIYKIFEEVAKSNKQFAKEFYRYRGIDYIPYKKDSALQMQVNALASLTADRYRNITSTIGIGFLTENLDGQIMFKNIKQTYDEVIDRSILAISQGKATFQQEMRRVLNTIGHSGLVLYDSGRTRRLDSAIRMNILDGIRMVNETTTKIYGEEYGADGVEISVHPAPAPDHADIQGRQFRNEEYEKLENGQKAKDVKGVEYDGSQKRHIAELNCYHKTFNIIVGVSKPEYSDKELKEIQEENKKGFDYEGKHYSLYEGTQLQRRLETSVRKEKDTQILARASGFDDMARDSQARINILTSKYNELTIISGLRPQKQRMSVSGYRKIKV